MLEKLMEKGLSRVIGMVVHSRENLTSKEERAQTVFLSQLDVKARKTKRTTIVAMIGLVGSGKSSVAEELARHIGATIIEGDAIRIQLRRQNVHYEQARAIAENIALDVVRMGGNVILDSDFVDIKKRASLREKARKADVRLLFVRTICDIDVMAQ